MFFVFQFLFLIIYAAETDNATFRNRSYYDNVQNKKGLIFQDAHNVSSVSPTLKSIFHLNNFIKTRGSSKRAFNKSLSNEILIKRHIRESDDEDVTSLSFKTTKSNVATRKLKLKQKWPIVELIPDSDDFKDNSHYFDDFEKYQFTAFHDTDNESKVTEFSPKSVRQYLDFDKTVELRSLQSQQKLPGVRCEDGDVCVCMIPSKTATPKSTTTPRVTVPTAKGLVGFPMGLPMGIPMGIPAGYPMGYPAGFPAGYPVSIQAYLTPPCAAGIPHSYYQPNIFNEVPKHEKPKKSCRTHHASPDDYLYYEDDDKSEKQYYENDIYVFGKKRKPKDDSLIDLVYDFEESSKKLPNLHSKLRENRNKLVTDIFDDLRRVYSESVIKNCYCCSSSSYAIKCGIAFLFFILLNFC